MYSSHLILFSITFCISRIVARIETGLFEKELSFNKSVLVHFQRSAFNSTIIQSKVLCNANGASDPSLTIDVYVRSSPCGNEFYERLGPNIINIEDVLHSYIDSGLSDEQFVEYSYKAFIFKHKTFIHKCDGKARPLVDEEKHEVFRVNSSFGLKTEHPLFTLNSDELYLLIFRLVPSDPRIVFDAHIWAEWKHTGGYLGPLDAPLLPFFGFMCTVYAFFAILWLIWCFWRWQDLLRIQYWIGIVIGIGFMEKMVFYIEYQKINYTGTEAEGATEFAEIMSCLKKTVSIVLVIIVSVGYGVVKPRLGATLQKLIGLGFVYFLLCSIDGIVRASKAQHESLKQKQIVFLPLLLMELGLFYWSFMSLVNTTRALRLRRNEVKLSLYRYFTYTMISFAIASVCFMIWSVATRSLNRCLKDWKKLWIDTAFWPTLFSILLFAIMILWRPTINNQRYAFTPLLDNGEDDDEEDTVFSEAFTTSEAIKLRTTITNQQNSTKLDRRSNEKDNLEDDLKWIEEHIPSTLADRALPAMVDSDEEREQTKFEISKMQ
uniref:Transmembrane protein 87A n=1 Tax=Romanomermis culicivorax TaxID=13658 RepID=A0A915IEE0_ROMCU